MESIASTWKALTPTELLQRYATGERDFVGINLLRTEIEYILQVRPSRKENEIIVPSVREPEEEPDYSPYGYPLNPGPPVWFHGNFDTAVNPLWADYRSYNSEFQWFDSVRFYDEAYEDGQDDIPTKSLSGVDLQGINLTGAYLYPVDLSHSVLRDADLKKAKLIDVDFRGADLRYVDLRRASLFNCDLRDANLHMARLDRAVFSNCKMEQVNMERAKLRKTAIVFSDLREANLKHTHFSDSILNGSHLEGIQLENIRLPSCRVSGVSIDESQVTDFLGALEIRINKVG